MKLYYTNPLKAAWMVRHHGVRLQRSLRGGGLEDIYYITWPELTKSSLFNHLETLPAFVHPSSYAIFEPQVGDLMQFSVEQSTGEEHLVCGYYEEDGGIYLSTDNGYAAGVEKLMAKYPFKIIQRNGKAFFMPEVENE